MEKIKLSWVLQYQYLTASKTAQWLVIALMQPVYVRVLGQEYASP